MLSMHLPLSGVEINLFILVAIGFAVGVLAGFFGMGGGWIITPALNIFGLPMPYAIGTGLANITGQSALATAKHRKMGNLDLALGLPVGICMVFGVEGGARLVLWLEEKGLADVAIRWFYILFLSGLGIVMLVEFILGMEKRSRQRESEANGEDPPEAEARAGLFQRHEWLKIPPTISLSSCDVEVSIWVLGVTGAVIGFLAGIMGAGGGFALVPVFVFLIGTPTYVAVGTSLICVMISGAYGAFTYAAKGRVELFAALLMMIGAAVGAQIGSAAIRHVRGAGVRLLYALMLLLAAGSVVMKQFAWNTPAAIAILGGGGVMCAMIMARMGYAITRSDED
jgi:hypothetical protein